MKEGLQGEVKESRHIKNYERESLPHKDILNPIPTHTDFCYKIDQEIESCKLYRHQMRSRIISVVEIRLGQAIGQKLLFVHVRVSSRTDQAFLHLEAKYLGKVSSVFVDSVFNKLGRGSFDFRLYFCLHFGLLLHFRLRFRLFLLFLLLLTAQVVAPFVSLFLPFVLDSLAFRSELVVALTVEESLYDIDSLVEKVVKRRGRRVLGDSFVGLRKWLIFIFSDHCEDFKRSLFGILNFQERMRMFNCVLTFLTEIEVRTDRAFVSNSFDALFVAVITSNILMDYSKSPGSLFLFLFIHWLLLLHKSC